MVKQTTGPACWQSRVMTPCKRVGVHRRFGETHCFDHQTKVVTFHALKTCGKVEVSLTSFLTTVRDRTEWSASTSWPIYLRHPSSRRQSWPQSRPARFGVENNVALPGIEPRFLSFPACSLVSTPTTLTRFPFTKLHGVITKQTSNASSPPWKFKLWNPKLPA
jgi:hypothetical protein